MNGSPSLFIDNVFKETTGTKFVSRNPASEEVIWQGRYSRNIEVHSAVQSSRKAFHSWSQLAVDDRIKYLSTFAGILRDRKDSLAETISIETGKPLWESQSEIAVSINKIDLTIDAFIKRRAQESEPMGEAIRYTRYKPHGVVAVFGPFNLPVHLPNGHILPALLAGNTVVFKPSEQTPLVGQKYVECWRDAELPPGVLNMIQGSKETGMELIEHVDLNGLFFTGSYQTGRAIHKSWAGKPEKILALEMGGNNPLIIDSVKDISAACYTTIQSAFITSGQRCVCARRLIIVNHKNTDQLLNHLIEMTKAIKVGDYLQEPQPFMGPVINKRVAKAILGTQQDLMKRGGNPLVKCDLLSGKTMLSPGIIDVTAVNNRNDEEIFGPLLQMIRVKDLEDAIKEANRTEYGLAAGILSDHRAAYDQFYPLSRCGVVNWNRPTTGASSKGPFGGIGKSGNFHPSAYFAADYCSYPVATIEMEKLTLSDQITPGIKI